MKSVNKYLIALTAAAAGIIGLTGCQNDFEDHTPTFAEPVATLTPNTTIAELKEAYWKADPSYVEEIGTKDDGSHYIIAGRVISSDEPGNVYKNLVIEDATAGLTISINRNALYLEYRIGQEIVMDVTGMNIGKYCGLMQLGDPQFSESYDQWQCTFMTYATFQEHTERNGFPEPSKVQPMVISKFSDLPLDPNSFEVGRYQSRLVRFNNVEFEFGGKENFCDEKSVTTSRNLLDAEGQSIAVRTSGYANFQGHLLPEGRGDIIAILSYYQTSLDGSSSSSPWQLTLIDEADCLNFGNPTMAPGDRTNPYTVDQVTEIEHNGGTANGWVTGVIVGAVYGEVTTITSNSDIEWGAPTEMNNTLVIAPTPECTNIDECLVVALPADSKLREVGNLRDNPGVYKKQIWLNGKFETYMGKCGITGNRGTASEFEIEGVIVDGGTAADGDGTKANPYSCAQVLKGLSGTGWATGYIVGWIDGKTLSTGAQFNANATTQTNLLIAATPDETDVNKCIPVQLPTGAVRTALNLQSNPGNYGKVVKLNGEFAQYFGTKGIKTVTEFELAGEGTPSDPSQPEQPSDPADLGTETAPIDVAKFMSLYDAGNEGDAWVEGYIVGFIPGKVADGALFTADGAIASNILLAASASETDYTKCIAVQLVANSDPRAALNLLDNPANLGKHVILGGQMAKYFSVCGLKSTSAYKF